ncbi:MAG: alpha/beta fold hydrolase [Planctomycetales bacterium]
MLSEIKLLGRFLLLSLLLSVSSLYAADDPNAGLTVKDGIATLEQVSEEANQVLFKFYDYEKSIPLETRVVDHIEKEGFIREKIVYRGVQGFWVPAYLQYPAKTTQPIPCVLLLHGWSGSKEHWWNDGGYLHGGEMRKSLLNAGYAVFAPDAQCHGDRIAVNDYAVVNHYADPALGTSPRKGYFNQSEIYLQSVRDFRRAIDVLETRKEINPKRIGSCGYSMGGAHTLMLMGVEPRIKVGVAAVPPAIRKQLPQIAPQNFVRGLGDRPLRTIMGITDPLCPVEQARGLQALMNPKTCDQVLIDAGHKLPESWVPQATEWLKKHL